MRRILLPLLAAALALLTLATVAHALRGHKVYVPQSSIGGRSHRPRTIVISGDSSYVVGKLHYSRYGGGVARAKGTSYVEDCVPDCAHGHVYKDRVRIALSRVHKRCGRYYYSRIDLYWPGARPKGFHRRDRRELGPFTCGPR